jgi:hydrogenase nickel incorporation protein HypB
MYHDTPPRPTEVPPADGPFAALVDLLDRLGVPEPPTLRAHRFGHHHGEEGVTENDVLAAIRAEAADLHELVVHDHDVFVAEFLGSTGSGKTRIIERLVERAPGDERIGAIVGDVAGDDDARRFRSIGVETVNVNTGKECHLDPSLVGDAVDEFDLAALDRLYVENVGNMVCPADFPLGAVARILVVSTTEGDDVVRKHPLLFQACDAAVVNKVDIAEAVNADVERMAADVGDVAPEMPVFRTSAREETGIDPLATFLASRRTRGHTEADHHCDSTVQHQPAGDQQEGATVPSEHADHDHVEVADKRERTGQAADGNADPGAEPSVSTRGGEQ